jgi:hypothetical protein
VNDLLAPLAVVGIAAFAIAVVLIGVFYARQVFRVVQLIRSGRISVRVPSGGERLETSGAEPLGPPKDEPTAPATSIERPTDTRNGWGFDRHN